MYGKPGVPKQRAIRQYNHARAQRPDLAHLPGERAAVALGWVELDGEMVRLPLAEPPTRIEGAVLDERPAQMK